MNENRIEESKLSKVEDLSSPNFGYKQILKDGGKQGVKAVLKIFAVSILFGGINLFFIIFDAIKYNESNNSYLIIILSLLIAFGSIFFVITIIQKYIIIDTLHVIYRYLTPFFREICVRTVDKLVQGGEILTGKDINKSLNVGALMIEVYGNKAPKFVLKVLNFIINRIPFSEFLKQMQKDLSERKNNKTLSEILYTHLENYIQSVFRDNSIKPVFVTLVINIILQISIIGLFSSMITIII